MPRGRPKGSKNKPKSSSPSPSSQPLGAPPSHLPIPKKRPRSNKIFYEDIPPFESDEFEIEEASAVAMSKEEAKVALAEEEGSVSIDQLEKEDLVHLLVKGTVAYKTAEKIGIRTKAGLRHLFIDDIHRIMSRTKQDHWLDHDLV